MFKIVNMKIILSILFISAATVVTIFFTAPQFMCTKDTCSYDGIKKLKTDQNSYITALSNAEDLDLRRTDLETKYNSVSAEDKQKLENLLPNNVDNIKLVLELETLAKKYGLLIESPKLQNEVETIKPGAPAGQDIRGTSSAVSYGTFSLDFTVRSSYENAKMLIDSIEKNLRLIEPVSITIKVPDMVTLDKNKVKLYPPGTYDVKLHTVIYYLKN
mgnify:CR=1 FL=1